MLRSLPCLVLLVVSATAAPAQTLTGTLVTDSGTPVPAALVTLVNEDGVPARAAVSRAAGQFEFGTSAAGVFTLRVDRAGFASYTGEPFVIEPGTPINVRLTLPAQARHPVVALAARGSCVAGSAFGRAAALWQQATLSLAIMALAEEAEMLEVRGMRYLRLLDHTGEFQEGIIEQEPFAGHDVPLPSPRLAELPETGFTTSDSTGATGYILPTPALLLSATFQQHHCIDRITTERARSGLVGLGFRPAGPPRGVGIAGVLWLDRTTMEVRSVEFEYRDAAGSVPRDARGLVAFATGRERLPQVSRWWVRVPRVFVTAYNGGGTARTATVVESGSFVFGESDRPLQDPEGIFALLGGVFTLDPITIEAQRAQRVTSEGMAKQIRLDEIVGAPPTDAWDIVRTLRPTWIARAASPALSDAASEGELVVYLDRMRLSTLNGDPDAGSYISAEDALSRIPASWIASIEYIPPIEAAAIYGMGHGYGVVVIRSRRQ